MDKKLKTAGYIAFSISGMCAISSGIIVSLLQERYGFNYSMVGILISAMSIGNMIASFAAGILPSKIGARNTVAILCSGYFLGYLLMSITGQIGILLLAFLMAGFAKGCTINNCTVLVGNHTPDRAKGLTLMHGGYALGALLCPFIIAEMLKINAVLPTVALAILGLGLWYTLVSVQKSNKGIRRSQAIQKEKSDFSFLKDKTFWILTGLIFCQNAAESSVSGWLVTYYKSEGILSGALSAYTVTVMWTATLIARLLIAFVFPIKRTYSALATMGLGCIGFYALLIGQSAPLGAICMLFAFAFAMAGVNPVATSGIGNRMNTTTIGMMLPIASLGQVIMPWIVGVVADYLGLQIGMLCILAPCCGILILSLYMMYDEKKRMRLMTA